MTNEARKTPSTITGRYLGTVSGPRITGVNRERQLEAARTYVQSRRTFKPEPLIAQLAADVVYESQDHVEALRGIDAVSAYLRERYEFLRSIAATRDMGTWRLAEIDLPSGAATPCALFELDGVRQGCHVASLDDEGRVRRIDILTVAPRPGEARAILDTTSRTCS